VGFEVLVPVIRHIHHDVAIARRKHGGTNDLCAIEERRYLPVAIDVAIPVNAPPESPTG
jgi:hypothetical protein